MPNRRAESYSGLATRTLKTLSSKLLKKGPQIRFLKRMEPMPLARTLAEPPHEILLKTKSLVTTTPTFDPLTSNRSISIIASDYSTEILTLDLLTDIAREAPGIKIALEEHTSETFERFKRGEINLRIIPKCFAFEGQPRERLLDEKYVCVAWEENKQIADMLTLEQYQSLQHVVRYSMGALRTTFDQQFLDQAGFSHNVSVTVPAFTLVPRAIAKPGPTLRGLSEAKSPPLCLWYSQPNSTW
jgi:DNA-binding transcriptional LysR family regulator